ncbi:hypothetical protein TNCV_223101 [Trichonephila clavipes]|nr:hypothetical protein TNCV_223101 [Trichonephila clavipes]
MEVAVFSFGEASCLVVVQTFTSSTQVQSTGPVTVTRFFFHMCVFLDSSSFSWTTTTMHHVIASSCRTALREQTLGSSTLPPFREDWRCKTNGQQCLNNSLTPHSQHGQTL